MAVVVACFLSASCGAGARRSGAGANRVLGELDRINWILRDCESGAQHRTVMPSAVAAEFLAIERDLNLLPGDATLVEFEVTQIPKVSAGDNSLAVMKVISVKRGKCGGAA